MALISTIPGLPRFRGVVLFPQVAPNILPSLLPGTGIGIDATMDQTHTFDNEVTAFPVGIGLQITDHIMRLPNVFTVQGILTDTPVQFFAKFRNKRDRAMQAFKKLLDGRDLRTFFTVVTTMHIHEDMVIQSLVGNRTPDSGGSINVSMTLRQVRVVSTLNAEVEFDHAAILAGAAATQDVGTQGSVPIP